MSLSLGTSNSIPPKKTLIVCDVQPDVVNKLQQPRKFVDLVNIAVQGARQAQEPSTNTGTRTCTGTNIVYTMLKFEAGYAQVPPSHPRLGILRRLGAKNPALQWFTSSTLHVPPCENENEMVVTRSTVLPHANDIKLMEVLRQCMSETTDTTSTHQFTVVGYGPTVQAVCNLLGDVLAIPTVQVLRECVGDESEDRCQAFLEHGLMFGEEVVSLVDFLEAKDLLHERIDLETHGNNYNHNTQQLKYVCDCGRGGHLSLYMPYLLRDHGYIEWPTQPWYQETKSLCGSTQYNCPLGRHMVDLCDEPQFSRCVRFFLAGRQHLDEKDLLHQLVPEFMPPTFDSIEAAQAYAAVEETNTTKLLWFIKAVNQNGGRAVRVTRDLPTEPLAADQQLQVHVPRPLLYEQQQRKCHVKTYQYLACSSSSTDDPSAAVWQLYMHDLFYLSTASRPWSVDDLSDDAQITTMRTHRLYPDNPWRVQWNLTEIFHAKMKALIQRAVEQAKLQEQDTAALQFEVNSADWMLDEDGRVYLIECNGIPVLYDAGSNPPQALVTKGLNPYDKLYKENPATAVVNDHDLIKEALGLALTGKLPEASLWKQVASIS